MRYDSAHSSHESAVNRANEIKRFEAYVRYVRNRASLSGSYMVIIPSYMEDAYLQEFPQRTDLREMFE